MYSVAGTHERAMEEQSEPTLTPKTPAACEGCGASEGSLKRCSRCKQVSYCSKTCQAEHWAVHKASCSKPAAHPAAAPSSARPAPRATGKSAPVSSWIRSDLMFSMGNYKPTNEKKSSTGFTVTGAYAYFLAAPLFSCLSMICRTLGSHQLHPHADPNVAAGNLQ
jgi:hypothetical protein